MMNMISLVDSQDTNSSFIEVVTENTSKKLNKNNPASKYLSNNNLKASENFTSVTSKLTSRKSSEDSVGNAEPKATQKSFHTKTPKLTKQSKSVFDTSPNLYDKKQDYLGRGGEINAKNLKTDKPSRYKK